MRLRIFEENGATSAEYALMIGLITAVMFGAVQAIGNSLIPVFTTAAGWFTGS
jgi:Flp pilus assembly pilin Flp